MHSYDQEYYFLLYKRYNEWKGYAGVRKCLFNTFTNLKITISTVSTTCHEVNNEWLMQLIYHCNKSLLHRASRYLRCLQMAMSTMKQNIRLNYDQCWKAHGDCKYGAPVWIWSRGHFRAQRTCSCGEGTARNSGSKRFWIQYKVNGKMVRFYLFLFSHPIS